MGKINRVEEMPVYQKFYELTLEVEGITRDYGSDFRWLRIQLLKSSESVCANMTEGFYAQYSTEYLQSLFYCRREARETVTLIRYANDVNLLQKSVSESICLRYDDALRQLANLIKSIERKIHLKGKSKTTVYCVREGSESYEINPLQPSTINH